MASQDKQFPTRPRRRVGGRLVLAVTAAALTVPQLITATAASSSPSTTATSTEIPEMPALSAANPGAEAARRRVATPYDVKGALPTYLRSPEVVASAPYTPLVRNLMEQLGLDGSPTAAQLANAAKLFQGLLLVNPQDTSCHAIGVIGAPVGTTPSISSLCWADSVGVNLLTGPNAGKTTATPEPLAIGASFDRRLANVWGQVEGAEGRATMVTGLYGPEADVSVQPNWERGLDTLGEDPYLNDVLSAAQVDGIQGRGLMSQLKHLAGFTGANRYTLTEVGDQAMHEMLLAPFESSVRKAKVASLMCAYEEYRVTSGNLPAPRNALYPASPYATSADKDTKTWPLDEKHWACEQPFALNYVLRHLWHSRAFVGSDYPAIHSTGSITQGAAQEFPIPAFFGTSDPNAPALTMAADDPTGDTCVLGPTDLPVPCSESSARHISGIAGAGCNPVNGCGLVTAVQTGNLPLAVFNQAVAEILYQEERFGLLGCDQTPVARTCTNPGGVSGNRSGSAALPVGPTQRATPRANLGTKSGDGAVVERMAEEGAVLLKNSAAALPLTRPRLRRGIAISGAGAEYLIAAPSNEATTGFPDRIAISPLRQLKALGPRGARTSFAPAYDPTGYPVPSTELSTQSGEVDGGLTRTAGPASPSKDAELNFTTVSRRGQLAPGDYTWTGYLNVPRDDTYTFRFQHTPDSSAGDPVSFALDGQPQMLSAASSFYCGQYFDHQVCVPVGSTNAGYTQAALTNEQTSAMALSPGYHLVTIGFRNDTSDPASFRFAYSRAAGDARDAADDARGKAAAVVFVNDHDVASVSQDEYTPPSRGVATLPADQVRLIRAVARANKNTIVVLNTADPVIVRPWISNPHVKAVLEMWNAGSEGGTATARLLLGKANPSGHTTITWPARPHDTLWGYNQKRPLYKTDTTGRHPERLNGLSDPDQADCNSFVPPTSPCTMTQLSQGIFSGYRYYDKQRLEPQFPFGYGLSYTTFRFGGLELRRRGGGLSVQFSVTNVGHRAGTAVAQVYVGPGPERFGVQQAVRALRGFQRVTLAPRQTRHVTIRLDARSFQYWNQKTQTWTTNRGTRTIWVGDAAAPSHLPLRGMAEIR